jgi:hypothetical protein
VQDPYVLRLFVNESEYVRQLNCSVTGYGCQYGQYDGADGADVTDGVDAAALAARRDSERLGKRRSQRSRHQRGRRRDAMASAAMPVADKQAASSLLQRALRLYPPRRGHGANNSDLVQWFQSDGMICRYVFE